MKGKKLFKVKNSVSIKRLWAMLVVLCMLAAMVPVSAEDTTATDIGGVELLETAVSSSINLKTCTVSADMKNVWVDVNIYNADSEEKKGILIFKADNSNNEFYVSTKPITVSASAETPAQIAINGLENKASAYNMKLYLWGKDNLEPITEVGVIPTINDVNTNVSVAVRSGAALANVQLLDTLVANVSDSSVTSRQWQVSTDAGTTWTDIAGETSAEYIVSAAQSGAKVRCVAKMDNNTNIASAAVDVPNFTVNTPGEFSRFGTVTEENDPNDAGYRKYTAAADKFTVDGRGFVLLDTFDNDESTYYVTTTDAYGDLMALSEGETPSGAQIDYDSNNTNAFLNGEFLTSGNKFQALGSDKTTAYKLPQGVINNINTDHTWWRFVNDYRKQNGVQSTYKAGVSLLSVTDFETYKSKLGVLDVFTDANVNKGASDKGNTVADVYFVRDTNNWGGNAAIVMCGKVSDDRAQYGYRYLSKWANQYGLLRPAFYLKKSFFKTTKIDLAAAGANVISAIKANCTDEELLRLYGSEDCKTYFGIDSAIKVTTSVRSGAELANVELLDTLVASVDGGAATEYKWQMQTSTGEWNDIEGATSNEYIVSAAQAGAKISCAAKVNDKWYYSAAVAQIPNYTVNATGDGAAAPGGTVDTTPADYKFTVDGKGFVLLDTFDNDESTYYVTTTDAYGDMQLLTTGQWWAFTSIKQINQDAYKSNAFLNGSFLTKGNNFSALGSDTTTYYKLPQGIIDNINKNHVWWRFVNEHKKQNEGVRSTYQTGVSLLSWTDFTTYAGKLGVKDVFNDSNVNKSANGADIYFLRDTNNWGGDNALALFYATDTEKKCVHWGQDVRPNGLLRPAFYLKKDFFKTTSIDLATAGANVISTIKANCTQEELLSLYSAEDCNAYLGMSAPTIQISARSGAALANVELLDTLSASVNNGTVTAYRWQVSTDAGTTWTDIAGETSAEYIVSAVQSGAKVRCVAKMDNNTNIASAAVDVPNYTVNATGDGAAAPGGTVDTTPADYKFTVDGKGFVLLDTFDNDESTYYVTTTDAYGDMQLLTADQWWVFTSNKQINQDAYNSNAFLNGDFLTNGNNFSALGSDTTTYYKLPQGIIDNINKNHVWWRFVNDHKKKNEGVRSTYQTGVSLLSWTDFTTYAGKLGVKDVFNDSNVNKNANGADIYFLRDTNNWGGDNALALFYATDTEKKCVHWGQNVRPNGLLRPAFYLKKSFFKTTSIDLATAGANVISAIKANCTEEELLALYGAEACETYLGITSTVKLTTSLRAGKDIADVQVLDTLVASAQSESGEQATGYQWQVYKDRSWNNIVVPTSTLNELVITADLAGAEVRCTAKVDEKTIYGSAIKIPEKISLNPNNDSEDGYAEYTPNKYMFTVGGKNFVLLDAFDNSQSTYYVTTKESYGDLQTLASRAEGANNDNPTGKQINYDSSKTTAFLNGDFLINGNKYNALGKNNTTYKKLPDDIINYINRDHIWWRYVNDYRKNNGVQSTYKAGVSLLSWTDFKTYAGKFGVSEVFEDADVNGGAAQMFYLRDTNGWGGDPSVTAIVRADGYHRAVYKIASDSGCDYGLLRPAFYLKEDFFKNVKLDLDATGESVLDIMRGRYSVEDLASIYTVAELEAKGFRHQGVNSSATLKIESDEVGNIFTDADDVKIRINSSNSDISYRVTDYDGNVVKSGTANPIFDFAELDFNSLDVGYYELAVQNNSAFNDSAEKTLTSFAIIPEFDFSQVQNSPFGINTHFELNWLGWDIKTIPLLKKAGIKSIRDGYYWGSMEQEKGKYENYWFFPNEQARLRLAGIDYLYCTAGENTLYDGGTYPYTGEGITGFANFSKKAAELFNHQYGDYKLNYMDMYNEWYNKWDETTDFINVFREVYQTVKGSYPDMTLFLGLGANEKFNNILNAGALDYCDGYEIHPYNWHAKVEDPENPDVGLAKQIDQTKAMVDNHNTSNKDLKFWITETGWPTIKVKYDTVEYDITDEEQANYLVRAYAIAMSKGVERVYWYDFTNDRDRNHVYDDDYFEHKENGEYNFGLIRNGFDGRYGAHTPKRSYVAYANLTRELANKSFVNLAENNNGTGTTYYYNFADSNGAKTAIACYVVLDGTNTDPSVSVNIKADEAVTVKNIEGKVIKTAQAGETFTLSVSAEPIYIEGGYTVQ